MTHYDLFAGIGGFSLALKEVFNDQEIKTIFCEWDEFCAAVLKKHWPNETYYGDIADLVADTKHEGLERSKQDEATRHPRFGNRERRDQAQNLTILTGGFPCQPFSAAGRRRGTSDDRYKWPEMFEVIRNVKPDWVIAENVRGLVTWNEGMVLEQVCTDLEGEGYEVQPFIIPAVAVNAPHRRDRVWIIAHATQPNDRRNSGELSQEDEQQAQKRQKKRFAELSSASDDAPNTRPQRRQTWSSESIRPERLQPKQPNHQYPDWQRNWQEVAFATCHDGVDDGLPRQMDGATISAARHRKERLKAMGNAIVPQVAMEIFKAIKLATQQAEEK